MGFGVEDDVGEGEDVIAGEEEVEVFQCFGLRTEYQSSPLATYV